METTLTVLEQDWTHLLAVLVDAKVEHMAFGGAGVSSVPGGRDLLLRYLHRPEPHEYEFQTGGGVRLSPDGVCRVMAQVREYPVLVDIHNHLGAKPGFSITDDQGAEVQYQILQDFSPGAVLVQLVFGSDGCFLARWTEPDRYPDWHRLDGIKVVGTHGIRRLKPWDAPTQSADGRLVQWARRRHLRTLPLFGEQPLVETCQERVGIVGLGGTGMDFLTLARFFFRSFVLVDPDRVEESNLGRLPGACESDARHAVLKVEVAKRELRRVDPDIEVQAVAAKFPAYEATEALKSCSVVVAGVDNNRARYSLAEYATRHMKILLDMGSGLEMRDGRVTSAGSQVRAQIPGGPCLVCLNLPIAQLEFETTTEQKVQNGYLRGTDLTPGEVITTNMTVATLALRNLLALLGGHLPRPVPTYLFYDEMQPLLIDLSSQYPRRDGCPMCHWGASSMAAWGDRLPSWLTLAEPSVSDEEVYHARP